MQVGPKRAAGVGKKEEGGGRGEFAQGDGTGRTRNFVFVEWATLRTCVRAIIIIGVR